MSDRAPSKQTKPQGPDFATPKYPGFDTPSSREETFKYWPGNKRQTPADLAEAGFFYVGSGDKVVCFHCGRGLQGWEDGDIPWMEHENTFADCEHVKWHKFQSSEATPVVESSLIMEAEQVWGMAEEAEYWPGVLLLISLYKLFEDAFKSSSNISHHK